MDVNKVVYGNETLIDLSGDSVTPGTLLQGATAHNAAGVAISGSVDLSTKQDKITASGILKGNGSGGVSAAVAGTDYPTVSSVTAKQDKITATGILKGAGSGSVSAATAGSDYISPSNLTTRLNRSNGVNVSNTSYTTYMARGIALNSEETTPTVNGTIVFIYG